MGSRNGRYFTVICALTLLLCYVTIGSSNNNQPSKKDAKPKKDLRDYTDADLERLYEEWEENDDEPLPDDELPEYKKPPKESPSINLDNIGKMSPDEIMKMTKKGKTVMMFINLAGNPTKNECEDLTSLWQGALRNNHIQAERYVVEDARAIFLFHDGAQAWDAKSFLLEQNEIAELQLEGQTYPGKGTKSDKKVKKSKNEEL